MMYLYLYLFQMENLKILILLHLIEAFHLQNCILHEDDSWNFENKGETDKKIPDSLFLELGELVISQEKSYLQAKSEIQQALWKCPFEKDKILLQRKLKTSDLPSTVLKDLRDQIMFYLFDSHILSMFIPYDLYQIEAESSPRLKRLTIKHNDHVTNIEWLHSFFYCPPRWAWA